MDLWWRHALGLALLDLYPLDKPADAPHGSNTLWEMDPC
jgi:hypothetical protein